MAKGSKRQTASGRFRRAFCLTFCRSGMATTAPPSEAEIKTVSDLATLEQTILGEIAAAGDEAALEAVRVAALGKKGSISALLATLGKMSPDERKTQGAAINLAKDKVTQALDRAPRRAEVGRARCAACVRDHRRHAADARGAGRDRPHPSAEPGMDELTAIFADMGFAVAEGPDIETDDYNFTKLNFPDRPSRARDARHLLLQSEGGRLAHAAAHPHLAGAGAHHADARSRRSA